MQENPVAYADSGPVDGTAFAPNSSEAPAALVVQNFTEAGVAKAAPDAESVAEPPKSEASSSPAQDTSASEPVAAQTPSADAEWLAQIKLLHSRFTEQERLSAARERIVDRLHEENQQLKQGELLKSMMPVYRDLMRLYDDLQKTAADYRNREQISVDAAVEDWQFFATAVTDLLYRYGVDLLTVELGMPFEPKSHRAALIRKTSEAERDKTVARVLSAGFSSDNRILRPAGIEVYRYEQPADTDATPQAFNTEGGNA